MKLLGFDRRVNCIFGIKISILFGVMNSFLLSKLCVNIVYTQLRVLRIPLSLKESLEGTDLFNLHTFGLGLSFCIRANLFVILVKIVSQGTSVDE